MNDIADFISATIEALRDGLVKTGNYAFTNVTNLIENQMESADENSSKHLIESAKNTEIVERIMSELSSAINTQTFKNRIESVASSVWDILEQTEELFTSEYTEIEPDIIRQAEGMGRISQRTINLLHQPGNMQEFILNPVELDLNEHLRAGSTRTFTLRDMENKIQMRFEHYFAPLADTELNTYLRNITQLFADSFKDSETELKWFKYIRSQPPPPPLRDFCNTYDFAETGHAYHIDEIKTWPAFWGHNWEGMIEGTNYDNILINAGGHNCKHHFEPLLDKEVSPSDMARYNRLQKSGLVGKASIEKMKNDIHRFKMEYKKIEKSYY